MISGPGSSYNDYSMSSAQAQKASGEKEVQELKITPELKGEIDKILDKNFSKDEPGCTCAIIQEGNVLLNQSIGVAKPGGKERTDTPQHLGSLSKQFTAMCIALLVVQNKVNLEDDICKCIPSMEGMKFEGPDGKPAFIRVKDLLHMQSGLPSNAIVGLHGLSDQDLTDAEKMTIIKKYLMNNKKLPFEPGKKDAYCNTNYSLLADLVSHVSGMSFREFAKKEIFDKLGMTSSGFIDPKGDDQMLRGYRKNKDGTWEDYTTRNCTWGACGVLATADDMAKWDGYFSNPENDKDQERILEIMRGPKEPSENLEYSWKDETFIDTHYLGGLSVGVSQKHDFAIEFHSGGIEGFETFMCRARPLNSSEKPLTVFIACNRDSASNKGMSAADIAISILEKCLNEKFTPPEAQTSIVNLEKAEKTKEVLKPDSIEGFAGKYHNPISGGECELKVSDDKLSLELWVSPAKEPFLSFKSGEKSNTFYASYPTLFIEFDEGKNFTFDDGLTFRNFVFNRIEQK